MTKFAQALASTLMRGYIRTNSVPAQAATILRLITLLLLISLPSWSQSVSPHPPDTSTPLAIPAPNACVSPYDSFYESEPGVYAYWALCESKPQDIGYDYLGAWPLVHGFTPNLTIVSAPGPVSDGETAARAPDAVPKLEQQGIFLNKHAGTLAAWINADATGDPATVESFHAINGKSSVSITVSNGDKQCFAGEFTDANGKTMRAESCNTLPNSWHRVVVTWNDVTLSLSVDGAAQTSTPLPDSLDDAVFSYQLFPGCCKTGKQMMLAKVSLANQTWTAQQIDRDFSPAFITPPSAGVEITDEPLGVIHRDVLGYVDDNQDISTPAILSALTKGLHTAGVTSVRYTGGAFAEAEDWRGNKTLCTTTKGKVEQSRNKATQNTLDNYMTRVVQPLGLDPGFVVNYGSNPPDCNAGGSPVTNAANLVHYANVEHHYGITRWEIGNEQYAYGGGPLIDLHPNPYTATNGKANSTYTQYEPAFYDAMKAQDPGIKIAVPSVDPHSSFDSLIHYQVPLLTHAHFDALVMHSYPITYPITDGATLYPDRVTSGTEVRGTLLSFQTQLLDAGRSPDAIWVTEWDAEPSGNLWSKQTIGAVMPLFAAMQLAEFMQAGVPYATWQAQGETDVCSADNYSNDPKLSYTWWNGCGDPALVYTGPIEDVAEKHIGFKPGDITPTARAFQLLSESGFVTEGEHMLRIQSDPKGAPWLMAYAATHGKSYAVLLINRDRDSAHKVPVRFHSLTSGGTVTQWTYGREQYDHTSTGDWSVSPTRQALPPWHDTFGATLPPWSISVFIFSR